MYINPFSWPSFVYLPPLPQMPIGHNDSDVFINNITGQGPKGDPGPQGPPGPKGETGSPGLTPTVKPATETTLGAVKVGDCLQISEDGTLSGHCKKILISEDYETLKDDWYIGVKSEKPITIKLSNKACYLIIKLEMKAPIGNRKVTLTSNDLIDGQPTYVLQEPYESISLIFKEGWNIISK